MSDSTTSLIPTAADGVGYGSTPAVGGLKKDRAPSSRTRVVAGVASACALLGVVAMLATGRPPSFLLRVTRASRSTTARAAGHHAALQKAARKGSRCSRNEHAPRVQRPGQRAHLGASEYEKCFTARTPRRIITPRTRIDWSGPRLRRLSRGHPAVTAYNDSKALSGARLRGAAARDVQVHVSAPTTRRRISDRTATCPRRRTATRAARTPAGRAHRRAVCNNIELSRKTRKPSRIDPAARRRTTPSPSARFPAEPTPRRLSLRPRTRR